LKDGRDSEGWFALTELASKEYHVKPIYRSVDDRGNRSLTRNTKKLCIR